MNPFTVNIVEDVLAFVAGIVAMGCFTGIITSWFKHRRPKQLNSPEIIERLNEITDRLSRLENATDAVAVEVERISEGQRFTSKLLAERASGSTAQR